ncbi:hypothetical protein DERP_013074 [Dermatophagoides pteronyssinus]|uniref:Uncharacterized protein n=1 Tax=Dermatophagoides pteronyssinus TaxID=6956 RepID=A0ABQ8JPW1_DERPT|nr:hypothetical protein DERP_013074 [Dermatophagoides pteronyssinus]
MIFLLFIGQLQICTMCMYCYLKKNEEDISINKYHDDHIDWSSSSSSKSMVMNQLIYQYFEFKKNRLEFYPEKKLNISYHLTKKFKYEQSSMSNLYTKFLKENLQCLKN